MRRGPWTSVSSQERSLADWTEQGRGLRGIFRRGPLPAARGKLGERERGSRATFGGAWGSRTWTEGLGASVAGGERRRHGVTVKTEREEREME